MGRKNLASNFYESFFGNGNPNEEDDEFELDNDEDIITKSESHSRILLLLNILAIFLLSLLTCLVILLSIFETNSILHIAFGSDKPHFEQKLLLYEYETVIEYDFGHQISKETLPIKVFDNSYAYIVHGKDLRLLNLIKRFTNHRSNFKDGHIVLSNSKPPLLLENVDYEA